MVDNGFALSSFKNYQVIRDINDVGIDWALGFLLQNSTQSSTNASLPWGPIGLLLLSSLFLVGYFLYMNPARWHRLRWLGRKQISNIH